MKQLKYYMMMLSALLFMASCSDDDDSTDTSGLGTQISLSADKLQVDKNGGTVAVTVTSDADWRLAGMCDWAHPSATEGRSGDEVTFIIDENTTGGNLSTTFKFFTGSAVAPLVIESVQDYTLELSSEETMAVEQAGGQVSIKLRSNIEDLSVAFGEGGEEWLSVDRQTEFGGEQIVILTAAANEAYLPRTATVTISSPLVEETAMVTLTQAPTEMFELSYQDEPIEGFLSCDMTAQTLEIKVVTNLDFTSGITEGSDWISNLQTVEGETAADGLTTYTVTCDVTESTTSRAGAISFQIGNGTTQTLSIAQTDPNAPVVEISSDFADELVEQGWILPVGDYFIVLEKGLNATVFDVSGGWSDISDLTGIENFPNLEVLRFTCGYYMEALDISGLHKVKELDLSSGTYLEAFNFGDNPIISFNLGDMLSTSYVSSMQFISERMEYLNCNLSFWDWSYVSTLDVTECPALKTLVADQFASGLRTIYVKEGQNIDITKPDNVEIEYR